LAESTFETVSADLEAYLRAELPDTWKIQDGGKALGNTTGLVLTYGLSGFSTTIAGQQLPDSWFSADIDLVLSAPETDLVKAQARLLPALPLLFAALDAADGVRWEAAERVIQPAGETWFRVPVSILVTTTPEE
jgi:hypothetical protein